MDKEHRDEMSRREFLAWAAVAAAAVVVPGCGEPVQPAYRPPARTIARTTTVAYASPITPGYEIITPSSVTYAQPTFSQPTIIRPPTMTLPQPIIQPTPQYYQAPQIIMPAPAPQPVAARKPVPVAAPAPAPAPVVKSLPKPVPGKVDAISRATWGATPAVTAKMRPMNGVLRVTIHHEGSAKPNTDSTPAQVAETLRTIQSQHRARMGAGDIGYHFIIDRGGTIWQGRDWQYQGAHTSGANPNNLGVMLLGNFEIQQPTPQQLASLRILVASLVAKYNLTAKKDIYGHCDFCSTKCPGTNLKPQVQVLRNSL